MILRRFAEALKQQNWTAITIEFVLLVLGVFLGIQVANWNAEMIDQHEARDALRRMEDDLRLSISSTKDYAEFILENGQNADLVLARLRDCTLPESDRDRFAMGLFRLGKINSARLVRTTFDELRDSGKLGLIGDAELRRVLGETVRSQETHEEVFQMLKVRMDPHIAYVDSSVIFDVNVATGGDGKGLGWKQLDIDFEAACRDRRLQAAVGSVRNYTYNNLSQMKRMQKRYETLLAMIEKENAR